MSLSGVNLAITRDGLNYNKLKRPDDYMASLSANVSALPPPTDSVKRTLDEAEISDPEAVEEPENKRLRAIDGSTKVKSSQTLYAQDRDRARARRPLNMDYGMQSMFPGMMDDAEHSDESMNEALAYLRNVRSEASTIPQLLVATNQPPGNGEPDRSMYTTGRGDYRAFYEDGAWVARDARPHVYSREASSTLSDDLDPQEQYYKKLLWRYEAMRNTLQYRQSAGVTDQAQTTCSRKTASAMPKNRREWLYILDREYPSPSLMSQFDGSDVLRGIKYCAQSLDRFESITKQKSCWIWALLAKTPDFGTMDYSRVGTVRDLGHKAGQFGMRLRSGVAGPLERDSEDDEVEDWEMEGQGIEEDVSELSSGERNPAPPENKENKTKVKTEELLAATEELRNPQNDESGAEMSMSEEEGEVKDNEPSTLEEARTRLLAQLGDRLVQTQPNSTPQQQSQEMGRTQESHTDGRHRSTSSFMFTRTNTVNHTALTEGNQRPRKPFSSRAEAELHQQQIRKRESELQEKTDPGAKIIPQNTKTAADGKIPSVEIPDLNSKVTIDMILTVVAECYGQKDLLRFRDIWAK